MDAKALITNDLCIVPVAGAIRVHGYVGDKPCADVRKDAKRAGRYIDDEWLGGDHFTPDGENSLSSVAAHYFPNDIDPWQSFVAAATILPCALGSIEGVSAP